jgi:hypothetical protein
MPLYPLCISRSRDVPNASAAVAEPSAVRWTLVGELACAFVDAPHDGLPPLRHAAAVEAIFRRAGALPLRFGAALDDEREIRAMLETRRGEFIAGLDRLAGACEMGLRITLAKAAIPAVRPETQPRCLTGAFGEDGNPRQTAIAYLERRRARYQDDDADTRQAGLVVERIVGLVQDECREWRKLPSPSPRLVRLAFLVERDRAAAFRGRLADCGRELSGTALLVLGPWPPYSFA